jgi:hypothetical protein
MLILNAPIPPAKFASGLPNKSVASRASDPDEYGLDPRLDRTEVPDGDPVIGPISPL